MVQIKSEKQYKAACERINELLKVVNNDTPADDKNMLELDLISDLVADYEEEHYPIEDFYFWFRDPVFPPFIARRFDFGGQIVYICVFYK